MDKKEFVQVWIKRGFAAGRTCRAQKIIEEGVTWYRTFVPGCGWIDYCEDWVLVLGSYYV